MPVSLSIIIVNYKSADLAVQCIRSIVDQTTTVQYEVIVVDNASNDDSERLILSAFPSVRFLQMGYNAGFARANNAGIKIAEGDVMLLINADTIVIDRAIERCYHRFIGTPDIACSVQLLNADLTPQISGNYFMKGGLNHLLPLPYYGKILKALALVLNTKKPNIGEATADVKVDWINGAFLMVKKAAIQQAGLMDEDFFLYAEEAEWCSRLKKAGTLAIYGDIRMIHLQGESINSATDTIDKGYTNLYDKKGLQYIVSNHLRIRKQYGKGWFLFQLINYTIAVPFYFLASLLDGILHFRNPFREWRRIKGLARNVFHVWRLSPTILSGRPHFYKEL